MVACHEHNAACQICFCIIIFSSGSSPPPIKSTEGGLPVEIISAPESQKELSQATSAPGNETEMWTNLYMTEIAYYDYVALDCLYSCTCTCAMICNSNYSQLCVTVV